MWRLGIACALVGCVGGASSELPKPPEPGVSIDVNVTAPTTHSATNATNATLAAVRNADGTWAVLEPKELGHYAFRALADRWAIAFVCADDRTSLVAFYERATTTTKLDVVLEDQCGPASVD